MCCSWTEKELIFVKHLCRFFFSFLFFWMAVWYFCQVTSAKGCFPACMTSQQRTPKLQVSLLKLQILSFKVSGAIHRTGPTRAVLFTLWFSAKIFPKPKSVTFAINTSFEVASKTFRAAMSRCKIFSVWMCAIPMATSCKTPKDCSYESTSGLEVSKFLRDPKGQY